MQRMTRFSRSPIFVWLFLFFALCAVPTSATKTGDTLFVADWGMLPNTYTNSVEKLQRAIEHCRQHGLRVIKLERGRYDFWPEGAERREIFISNTSSETECPSKVKTIGVLLEGMHDLTIDGGGATLMFHGKMTMLAMLGCRHITLTNLHFDFERPGGSELAYSRVGTGYAELTAHRATRYEICDGRILLYGEGWRSDRNHCIKFSPDTGLFAYSDDWQLLSRCDAEEVSPGVVRFKTPDGFTPRVGDVLTVRDIIRDQVGMLIAESKDVALTDVYVHYMHGLGIVSQYSENITMERLFCEPREHSGRVLASSADFTHFSGCKGRITIANSRFSGAQDDCINVHGTNLQVDSVAGRHTVRTRFMHPQSYGYRAFFAGDTVAFVRATTMQRYARAVVVGVKRVSDRVIELELDRDIPRDVRVRSDCVENLTCTPEVEIQGNLFTHTSTRGTLVTTPRRVVIADNTYVATGMSAILIEADAASWFESGAVTDVLIKNNRFVNCAVNGHPAQAVIAVNPSNEIVDARQPVHRNIRICNNVFQTFGNPIFYGKSVRGLQITGNRIEVAPASAVSANPIILKGCSRAKVGNNPIIILSR